MVAGSPPNDRSVLIFLAHNMVDLQQIARGIGLSVWSTIATFHSVASASYRESSMSASTSAGGLAGS